MFVRETFNGESKHKAEVMIDEVKTAFKNDLPSLLWMDDETRAAAIDKVRHCREWCKNEKCLVDW